MAARDAKEAPHEGAKLDALRHNYALQVTVEWMQAPRISSGGSPPHIEFESKRRSAGPAGRRYIRTNTELAKEHEE
jgi:hypothetical protein